MADRGPHQLCMADIAGQPFAGEAMICTSMMLKSLRTCHAEQHASCAMTWILSSRDACCMVTGGVDHPGAVPQAHEDIVTEWCDLHAALQRTSAEAMHVGLQASGTAICHITRGQVCLTAGLPHPACCVTLWRRRGPDLHPAACTTIQPEFCAEETPHAWQHGRL